VWFCLCFTFLSFCCSICLYFNVYFKPGTHGS
jgi:hypothetical protein